MTSKNRTLKKAIKLLIRGHLTRCIQLLEPKISLFIDDADYFYLLGRCYFAAGDAENAKLYLQRGLENDPEHEEIQLMQACFAVKQGNTYKAISIWLKLENAGCRRACMRYGLDQIRRINDREELHNFAKSPKFARLYPVLPGSLGHRYFRFLWRVSLLAAVLAVLWLGYDMGTPRLRQFYSEWSKQREQATAISLLELDPSEYFSFEKRENLFVFDEKQLNALIRTIRKNYDLYHDNVVQRDINKILLSNASNKVKAKFRIVENLLGKQQEIFNLKNNFSYREVLENPQLYQNCFVRWQGRPTNIRIGEQGKLQFVLLVGYTDGRVIDGQVLVELKDLISVPTDRALTLFGQVRVVELERPESGAEQAGEGTPATFYIEAKTLSRS